MKNEAFSYLISLIHNRDQILSSTINKHAPNCNCWTNCINYLFFQFILNDWFNLQSCLWSCVILQSFNALVFSPQVKQNLIFIIRNVIYRLPLEMTGDCFGTRAQKIRRNRYQSLSVLSNFAKFFSLSHFFAQIVV